MSGWEAISILRRTWAWGVSELRDRFGELQSSAVYRSKAIGFEGDDFLNLVASFESDSSPLEICDDDRAYT